MYRARSRYPLALLLCLFMPATGGAAPATTGADHVYIGTYTVTQVGGAGVQHTELQLRPDGRASLRTVFSRYTERPVASAPVPPVLERGTWHARKGRAVVHIASTSDDDANAAENQKPQYSDLTFELSGCLLRLVTGSSPTHEVYFSKKHCTAGS